jgi:hypothetical protein
MSACHRVWILTLTQESASSEHACNVVAAGTSTAACLPFFMRWSPTPRRSGIPHIPNTVSAKLARTLGFPHARVESPQRLQLRIRYRFRNDSAQVQMVIARAAFSFPSPDLLAELADIFALTHPADGHSPDSTHRALPYGEKNGNRYPHKPPLMLNRLQSLS